MPRVTVIIPAYNEEDVIDDCLSSLVTQSVADFKVLMVDDSSTDQTARKIRAYAEQHPGRIELKQYGKVGPGRARNLAARDAESEFIAFMDADCIATPTWLEELLAGFLDISVGSVGGPHLAPDSSSPFQRRVEDFFAKASPVVDFYKSTLKGIREVPHNPLCNVAYRRDVFQRVNGFREDLFPGEDTEIDFKVRDLKFRILFNPKALVYHHRPESIQQFRKVMHAYGRAQGKLVREYGLRRRLQWVAVGCLAFMALFVSLMIVEFSFVGFCVSALLCFLFFFYRPKSDGCFAIGWNGLHWFNGFLEGLITNKSLPPGYSG